MKTLPISAGSSWSKQDNRHLPSEAISPEQARHYSKRPPVFLIILIMKCMRSPGSKAIALGITSSLFFSITFILNRAMSLEGGSWIWSASLRFYWMIPRDGEQVDL